MNPTERMKVFIERNGVYNNYQTFDEEAECKRKEEYLQDFEAKNTQKKNELDKREQKENETILIQQEESRLKTRKL